MSSIVDKLIAESVKSNLDDRSLNRRSLRYLLEAETKSDEKKVDTAIQRSTKAMKVLGDTLSKSGLPETGKLILRATKNLSKAIASGESDEESAALFTLMNQFGASLLSLLNNINNSMETVEPGDTVKGILGELS